MQSLEIILERATRSYSPVEKAAMADAKNATYRDLLSTLTPADALPGAEAMLAALDTTPPAPEQPCQQQPIQGDSERSCPRYFCVCWRYCVPSG